MDTVSDNGKSLKKQASQPLSCGPGLVWLLAIIIGSLTIARLIFWAHGWNFSWIPEGLPEAFLFFFVVVHLVFGPLFVLICDITGEMIKIMSSGSGRPSNELLLDFMTDYCSFRYILLGVVAYLLVGGAVVGYLNLKPTIPLLNHNLYDKQLFALDGYLFKILSFGDVIELPKEVCITKILDNLYFNMWTLSCVTLVVCFRDVTRFWRFTAAWCVAFTLSVPISVFLPSLGPAFYKPNLFKYIEETDSFNVMQSLWEGYIKFQADPFHGAITRANGIAAMPSLHIALVYLSVRKLVRCMHRLQIYWYLLLLLYITATVYLGWHYLLDGVVGILLGWQSYNLCTLWFPSKKAGG